MKGRIKRLLDWRSMLVYTHRWLGILGCVLFAAWFISGIVMMYARMPTLAEEERLARSPALDLTHVTVSPAEAAETAAAFDSRLEVAVFQGRPVYRFGGGRDYRPVVFADDGTLFEGVNREQAEAEARRFEPSYTGPMHHEYVLEEPDQWTLQAQANMPYHRFTLDDAAGTVLYVSETSGEVFLRTTRRDRFWGYLGPVLHWVYFTPFRSSGRPWYEFMVWSSLIGCAMCVSGLVWGLMRFSPFGRFRLRRQRSHTPYAGMMRWHHYAGLLFGVVTLTWAYSGLLSLAPFDWFQPSRPGGRVGRRGGGEPIAERTLDAVTLDGIRSAYTTLSHEFPLKAMQIVTFQGEWYWVAERPPLDADAWRSPSLMPRTSRPQAERRYVSVDHPESESFASFPREKMPEVAAAAMPGVPIQDSAWLTEYDGYYYDMRESRPLPVLRVRYLDDAKTWLYVDPGRGSVVQRSESITRLRRWLYQGFHSLDFPFLYYKRPLWDIVVIVLSVGGVALSVTTMWPAWRRLVRHGRKWVGLLTGSRRRQPEQLRSNA